MTYPNGRILRYEYEDDDDDALSRISYLADDNSGAVGTHLAEYTRLGMNSIVQVDCTEPDPSAPEDSRLDLRKRLPINSFRR